MHAVLGRERKTRKEPAFNVLLSLFSFLFVFAKRRAVQPLTAIARFRVLFAFIRFRSLCQTRTLILDNMIDEGEQSETEMLIRNVEARPFLYNRRDAKYKVVSFTGYVFICCI